MKNLNKAEIRVFFVAVAFLICGFVSAQPQDGGHRGDHPGPPPIPNDKQITEMVSELADQIELSEEQETQVFTLYKAHFKQVKSKISENEKPDRKEMEALKTSFEKQVKTLLTDDQQLKFVEFMKEKDPGHGPHPQHN